jgi:hypothetical protein
MLAVCFLLCKYLHALPLVFDTLRVGKRLDSAFAEGVAGTVGRVLTVPVFFYVCGKACLLKNFFVFFAVSVKSHHCRVGGVYCHYDSCFFIPELFYHS